MPEREHKIVAGRYEVVSKIGAGGVAVVYRARDTRLSKDVALKMLHPELMTGEAAMRFQMEAKMASTLLHPNLIRVLDFGITAEHEPYLVMDFVDGTTLSEFLDEHGPLPITSAAGIFIQICDGMAVAHEKGVVHRDLKSSNIMLTETDSPHPKAFVLDFGLAKKLEDPSLTRAGLLIGSPAYMSPEHARGMELDNRADIYSMGCIMYETLTGVAPITGDTVLDTIMRQTTEPAPSLSQGRPQTTFSAELERMVATALKKSRQDRFQTMRELQSSIEALRELQRSTQQLPARQEDIRLVGITPVPPPISGYSAAFFIACITLIAIIGGIGLMVAPTVPGLIEIIHPVPKDDVAATKPEPVAHDQIPEDDILPGSSRVWAPIKWNDGITWYKKFNLESDAELLDTEKFHEMGMVSFWQEAVSPMRMSYMKRAQVRGLYLSENDGMTYDVLSIVGKISSLKVLNLDKNKDIPDVDLRFLPDLKNNLLVLGLSGCHFTDEALRYVGELAKLEILHLDHMPNIEGYGLKYLTKLQNLEKLDLSDSGIEPKNLGLVSNFKELKILYLHEIQVDAKAAGNIAKLPKLEILDVSDSGIKDEALLTLKNCKTLKEIYVHDHKASPEVMAELKKQPGLTLINDKHPRLDNFLNKHY